MTIAVTEGCGPEGTAPEKSSGIRVIIVGCGYGGIAAAIECHRKGHEVVVFEKNQEVGGLGTSKVRFFMFSLCLKFMILWAH